MSLLVNCMWNFYLTTIFSSTCFLHSLNSFCCNIRAILFITTVKMKCIRRKGHRRHIRVSLYPRSVLQTLTINHRICIKMCTLDNGILLKHSLYSLHAWLNIVSDHCPYVVFDTLQFRHNHNDDHHRHHNTVIITI